MSMGKRIAIAAIAFLVIAVGITYLLPREIRVVREVGVDAPISAVFALVDGFDRFNDWSPWVNADPDARYVFDGPDRSVGARMSWDGDPDTVGTGTQTIIERVPFEKVRSELDFGSQGAAMSTFTLSEQGEGTLIRWEFETDMGLNPLGRWMGLFMDRWVGGDYETGLASIKGIAEKLPKVDFRNLEWEEVEVRQSPLIYVEASCGTDEREIQATFASAFARLTSFVAKHRLEPDGPPRTINHEWGESGYRFDAAIPLPAVPDIQVPVGSPVRVKSSYAGKALRVVHRGAYDGMRATYDRLFACAAAYGFEPAGPPWDEFVNDPGDFPEADLLTQIYLPVR
jgi:effector-binding domain-containing protein